MNDAAKHGNSNTTYVNVKQNRWQRWQCAYQIQIQPMLMLNTTLKTCLASFGLIQIQPMLMLNL